MHSALVIIGFYGVFYIFYIYKAQIIYIQMQASIIKQLTKLPALNSHLAEYLKTLHQISTHTYHPTQLKNILILLTATTCQTRNLLHYRHLQERSMSEKCLLLVQDLISKIINQHPQLLEHVVNDFLAHIVQHPSCYISLASFFMIIRSSNPNLQVDRLRKIMHKVISCFEEAGEMKFLKEIAREDDLKWENARINLQSYLSERYKPTITQNIQDSHISLSKIPPLILPSNKSINSSRYSIISKEQRTKGLRGLHQLASMIGQGFIAVQLGCLLAHKRTQQVQQFSQNSDYRNKCLQQIETERIMSSRLSMSEGLSSQGRASLDKQMDQTNKRYYKKVLIILFNIINMLFEPNSSNYENMPLHLFILDFIDLYQVGLIDSHFNTRQQQDNIEYFSLIKIDLKNISQIFTSWSQRVSFLTQKKHLKLLWNRNKKNSPYSYQQARVERHIQDEILLKQLKITKVQHLKQMSESAKGKPSEKADSDFIILQLVKRFYKLFGLCDMNNSRFYKYEANLLGILASYLKNVFSSTIQYLSIDTFFPILVLIKRQILQLSHPYLDKMNHQEPSVGSRKFSKKEKNNKQPLIVVYPQIFSNFLLVIAGLMSNQRYVEKLLSTVFIKCNMFMETLEKYTHFLFQNDKHEQIKKVLYFYRKCLETYSQRKLRNTQSKSIKTLFGHLTAYFYPRVGCVALKLQEKQHLISCNPSLNESNMEEHLFLHDLLQFIKDIFYYCQDELAETLLQEQIASFYIKFSLLNFIKLYSFLTVTELVSLQSENYEPTTKQSPHISKLPQINTTYMIDFIKILTNISINRTYDISRKIKQYRILEFFIREFELQFEVSENVEKYIKKVSKPKEVIKKKEPQNVSSKKNPKVPSLSLKFDKSKTIKTVQDVTDNEGKPKKNNLVPSLKLPIRQSFESKQKNELDGLLQKINQKPQKKHNEQLNLNLTKLNLQREPSNQTDKSSERNVIYSSERRIRKIYSNKVLHSESILLVLSLLLNKGLLDSQYCDQFPITHGKVNVLYILHHHLNEESNKSVIPILAESVGKIKPYLCGQRLLKLLSTSFTDLSHYCNWKKISSGAYGVIYSCQTKIQEPREIAIKEMSFPRSIYQRCVLHDIFTEITCLQNFRLDQRVTTMYNYGVVENSYIIVMKRYDCSLRDWILVNKERLPNKLNTLLKIFWDVLQIILLLHQKSVIHYDLKADNILLQIPEGQQNPKKVVLGDFGQCKIFQQSKEEIDMKSRGTQCIKSPEMLTLALHLKKESDNYDRRKKAGTTRASDIWSLGCLFYELLTGEYLFHRADWVNFYVQVTNPNEELLNKQTIQRLQKYHNTQSLIQFLRICLIRDPHHRPQIKSVIQKFKDLFGDMTQAKLIVKSPLIVQKDLQNLVSKYIEQIKKDRQSIDEQKLQSKLWKAKQPKIRGVRFNNSINNSKSNKFMRIMQDIFYCENINLVQGGYEKMKELKISHVVTTSNHPLLLRFNTLIIDFEDIKVANLAFRLAPKISDLLREVLLLKGRLLFINDKSNYATNLLIYTLSYWFRCSVYQTWCLINTQILLFPTFTSDLLSLSSALKILNDIEQKVEELPKLQCICGTITFILKDLNRNKKRTDLNCKCKKKKINEYANMASGPECVTTGCQSYLEFVKKRYCISWESIRWASILPSSLLTTVFPTKGNEQLKTQILLNSSSPHVNLIENGSCVKGWKVYSCRVCQMMMMATSDSRDEILLVMNNMLRRIRQGIMIPNAQQSFAKKTPALSYFTLTKLHMTQVSEQ